MHDVGPIYGVELWEQFMVSEYPKVECWEPWTKQADPSSAQLF